MTYLEEIMEYANHVGIKIRVLPKLDSVIITSWAVIPAVLTSVVRDSVPELLEECNKHSISYVYNIEELAASGKLMMRFEWVD